jgi:hypothetical protein
VRPLELNLASRPFKNDTLPWLGAILCAGALVAGTVWNVRTYRDHALWVADLRQQYADRDTELEDLHRRETKAQREIEQFDRVLLAVRADKANEVIRWKGFSWTRLFNHMEEVLPNNVQMSSISPVFRPDEAAGEGRGREVRLEGRVPVTVEGLAKGMQDFFELERNLYGHPHFDQVEPERHDTDEQTGVTSFSLRFLYDSRELPGDAAPAERVAEAAPDEGPREPPSEPVAEPEAPAAAAGEPNVPVEGPATAVNALDAGGAPGAAAPLGSVSPAPAAEPTAPTFGEPTSSAEAVEVPAPAAEPPKRGPRRPGGRRRAEEGG